MKKIILLIFLVSISGCIKHPITINQSRTKQITYNNFKCDVFPNRASEIQEKYKQYFQYGSYLLPQAANLLSGIPGIYFNFVFDKHHLPIYLFNGAGNGVTELAANQQSNGQYLYYPTKMNTDVKAIAHEFGHASMGQAQREDLGMYAELSRASIYSRNNYSQYESLYLRAYPDNQNLQTRLLEFWAELFDSWYCSQDARDYIKEHMPKTYDFASIYLHTPITKDIPLSATSSDIDNLVNLNFTNSEKIKVALSTPHKTEKNTYYIEMSIPDSYKNIMLEYCPGQKSTCSLKKNWEKAEYLGSNKTGKMFFKTNQAIRLNVMLSDDLTFWIIGTKGLNRAIKFRKK